MLSVIIYLSIVILSFVTLISSLYGIGKNEDSNLIEYKVSIAFFVMSLISSVGIVVYLHQGNMITAECKNSLFEINRGPAEIIADVVDA